jgi:prepilin-type N-terminal cleavage/methylation domain-containing protein
MSGKNVPRRNHWRSEAKCLNEQRGFSLLELLVCVAIVAILMAMNLTSLSKAYRQARGVASAEGMRQQNLVNKTDDSSPEARNARLREYSREQFRKTIDTGNNDSIITEMVFQVENDDEMRAYWNTVLNPGAEEPLEYASNGDLIATDSEGNIHYLPRIDEEHKRPSGNYPVMWEFLSTSISEMGTQSLMIQVLYNDGHIEKLRYPSHFPASRTVAEVGHFYMLYVEQ